MLCFQTRQRILRSTMRMPLPFSFAAPLEAFSPWEYFQFLSIAFTSTLPRLPWTEGNPVSRLRCCTQGAQLLSNIHRWFLTTTYQAVSIIWFSLVHGRSAPQLWKERQQYRQMRNDLPYTQVNTRRHLRQPRWSRPTLQFPLPGKSDELDYQVNSSKLPNIYPPRLMVVIHDLLWPVGRNVKLLLQGRDAVSRLSS